MIVTTFSPEGYELYGKNFIKTYRQFCSIPLVVYVEDDIELDGIETRNLFDVPKCQDFLNLIGEFDEKKYKDLKNGYRWNANKFCRKVFAMTDAASRYKGTVVFLGGDTVFLKGIPESFFDDMLKDVYLAYLGRKGFHSETDFIAFDTTHDVNQTFMELFVREYLTGAYQGLKHYCDSDVFDHIRLLLSVPTNNINTENNMHHPFVNSVLGRYLDHLKGERRKVHGSSFDADYKKRITL